MGEIQGFNINFLHQPLEEYHKFMASTSPGLGGGWGGVFVQKFAHVSNCWLDIGTTVSLKHG